MEDSAIVLRAHDDPVGRESPPSPGESGQAAAAGPLRHGCAPPYRASRKGHTKSRAGCLTCKKRRVKCPENTPACNNCVRLGLLCEYASGSAPNNVSPPLQSTGGQFNMKDFKLFHHFALHAYPPLPVQGKHVWDEILSFSHNFDFLVHSMLGLAASHMYLCGGADHRTEALAHRVTAMKLLNQALGRPPASKVEGDARYATLIVLAFQSSYMPDGMLDVFHLIRGCMIITHKALPKFAESLYKKFLADGAHGARGMIRAGAKPDAEGNPGAMMKPPAMAKPSVMAKPNDACMVKNRPTTNQQQSSFLADAADALKELRSICRKELEFKYLGILDHLVAMASVSFMDTLLAISAAYNFLGRPSQTDFNSFLHTQNPVGHLLIAHFFLLEYVIGLKVLGPIMRAFPFRSTMIRSWIGGLTTKLPPEYLTYLDWPLEMLESLETSYLELPEIPKMAQRIRPILPNSPPGELGMVFHGNMSQAQAVHVTMN